MKNFHHITAKIPLTLKAVSLYVVAVFGLWQFQQLSITFAQPITTEPSVIQTAASEEIGPTIVSGQPGRLQLPRLGLDLEINEGFYTPSTNSWNLAEDAVQYAVMSRLPNDDAGITLIYGHNTWQVLGATQDIQVGDVALVKTKNNLTFKYVYKSDTTVDPTDTAVLNKTSAKPQLILMTCDGWWNQIRRLMTFEFKGVV